MTLCVQQLHTWVVPSNASGNRKSLARWMLKLLCHQLSCNVIPQFITAWHLANEIFVRYTTNRVTFVRSPPPPSFRTEKNLFSNLFQGDPNLSSEYFRMHCTLPPWYLDASARCLQLWQTKASLLCSSISWIKIAFSLLVIALLSILDFLVLIYSSKRNAAYCQG